MISNCSVNNFQGFHLLCVSKVLFLPLPCSNSSKDCGLFGSVSVLHSLSETEWQLSLAYSVIQVVQMNFWSSIFKLLFTVSFFHFCARLEAGQHVGTHV